MTAAGQVISRQWQPAAVPSLSIPCCLHACISLIRDLLAHTQQSETSCKRASIDAGILTLQSVLQGKARFSAVCCFLPLQASAVTAPAEYPDWLAWLTCTFTDLVDPCRSAEEYMLPSCTAWLSRSDMAETGNSACISVLLYTCQASVLLRCTLIRVPRHHFVLHCVQALTANPAESASRQR